MDYNDLLSACLELNPGETRQFTLTEPVNPFDIGQVDAELQRAGLSVSFDWVNSQSGVTVACINRNSK